MIMMDGSDRRSARLPGLSQLEGADQFVALQTRPEPSVTRIAMIVPLVEGTGERARALFRSDPPLDPAALAIESQEVFVTDSEIAFVFETSDRGILEHLAGLPLGSPRPSGGRSLPETLMLLRSAIRGRDLMRRPVSRSSQHQVLAIAKEGTFSPPNGDRLATSSCRTCRGSRNRSVVEGCRAVTIELSADAKPNCSTAGATKPSEPHARGEVWTSLNEAQATPHDVALPLSHPGGRRFESG